MDIDYALDILPYILDGLKITATVFAFAIVISLLIGIVLGFISTSKQKGLVLIIETYTWIFRGTPLLLQLYFGMYGLPAFGIVLNRLHVAILIFSLNYGAYFAEIFRGVILSIDEGQIEVSKTLGFNKLQTYIYIVMPQALKRSIQAVGNETINLVKDTALVAAIALNDLLRNAKEIVSRDFKVDAFFIVGIIYILISFVIVKSFKKVEKKYEYFR